MSALSQRTSSICLVLLQSIYWSLIWLPNICCLILFSPYLASEKSLQSNLITKTSNLVIDIAQPYACAKIAQIEPTKAWDLHAEQNWFKHYTNVPASIDLHATGQLSPPCHTPQMLAAFMLLTYLPINKAIVLFLSFSLLFMVASITVLLRATFKINISQIIYWWLIALTTAPMTWEFYLGQSDAILAGLAAIFLLTWRNKQCIPASLVFALTLAIKPQCALVMVAMSLAARKFGLLLYTSLFSLIFLLATINILGLQAVMIYPLQLLSFGQAQDNYQLPGQEGSAIGLLGPISLLAGRHTASVLGAPFSILALAIIYLIWRKALAASTRSYPFAYASSVLISLILGPRQHFYSLILLTTVWATTVPVSSIKQLLQLKWDANRLWYFVFFCFPPLSWILCYFGTGFGTPGIRCLPVLLFMLFLALSGFRQSYKS